MYAQYTSTTGQVLPRPTDTANIECLVNKILESLEMEYLVGSVPRCPVWYHLLQSRHDGVSGTAKPGGRSNLKTAQP